jgi:hypothetical protein
MTVCRDKRQARRILDEFNQKGRVMLKADLELLAPLLAPKPVRLASPLMQGPDRTHTTRGMVMADNPEQAYKDVAAQVTSIEQALSDIEAKASQGALPVNVLANRVAVLTAMVRGQGDNRASYAAASEQNAAIANVSLDKLTVVAGTIDRLEAAGRPFNATRAREEVLAVGSGLRHVLGSMDVGHPDADTEIRRLAERADRLHGLFANAK